MDWIFLPIHLRPGGHHAPLWSLCSSSQDLPPNGPSSRTINNYFNIWKGSANVCTSRSSPSEPILTGSWASFLSPREKARTGALATDPAHQLPWKWKHMKKIEKRFESPLGLGSMVPPPWQEMSEMNQQMIHFPRSGNLFLKGQTNLS